MKRWAADQLCCQASLPGAWTPMAAACRRQTNKDSARRVKQLKAAEVQQLRVEVQELVAASSCSAGELQDIQDHCRRLESDLQHYQELYWAASQTVKGLQHAATQHCSQVRSLAEEALLSAVTYDRTQQSAGQCASSR